MYWLLRGYALLLVLSLGRPQEDRNISSTFSSEIPSDVPTTELAISKILPSRETPLLTTNNNEESSISEDFPSATSSGKSDGHFDESDIGSSPFSTQESIDSSATSIGQTSSSSGADPSTSNESPASEVADSDKKSDLPGDTEISEASSPSIKEIPTISTTEAEPEGTSPSETLPTLTTAATEAEEGASNESSPFIPTSVFPAAKEMSTTEAPEATSSEGIVDGGTSNFTDSPISPTPQPDDPSILAKKEHVLMVTFQYNCSPSDNQMTPYKEILLNSTQARNSGITDVRVETTQCFSTFQVNVTYDEEQLISDLEHQEMVELKLLNRSFYVKVTSHPHHETFSRREMMIYVIVGVVLGLVTLSALLIFCIKCCTRRRNDAAGLPTTHTSLKDRPRFTMDMEGMSLTRIPRPALSSEGIRRDDGMVQPFDTSVVPMEDAQKLDDIRRYRQGDMPEVTLRTFDSKRSSQWKNENDSKERLTTENVNHEIIRNGVENPTYAKF